MATMMTVARVVGLLALCVAVVLLCIIGANQLDGREVMGGMPAFNIISLGFMAYLAVRLIMLRREYKAEREEEEVE